MSRGDHLLTLVDRPPGGCLDLTYFPEWEQFLPSVARMRSETCVVASSFLLSLDQSYEHLDWTFALRYAMLDFTLLDKRLGTLQELRDLVNAAHNLGMYVIVDVFASALVASDENLTRVQFSEGQAIVSLGVLAHS